MINNIVKNGKNKNSRYFSITSLVIFCVLIFIVITMGIFSFLNKNKAKVVETKIFSEMPGFSFEYPVFKGWAPATTRKLGDNEYRIFFSAPFETGKAPSMIIKKDYREEKILANKLLKNPNGVQYISEVGSTGEVISFFGFDYVVEVYPYMHEGDGYSGTVMKKKIIETFKFTNCTPEAINAVPLNKLTDKTFTQDIVYLKAAGAKIIENLEERKENPDDFYVNWDEFKKSGLNGSLITFHLSHKDDFKPENCNMLGNPSGKSRDMVYDTNQNKIIKVTFWR